MSKKNPLLKNCQLGKHIDLGCGSKPRNPYSFSELYGCDIRSPLDFKAHADFTYAQANLTIEKIPFPDNFFNSLSAYDFIEHIPRVLYLPERRNSFVELMNEVWRVLVVGGKFISVTPAYPNPAAFVDPTHVNIITEQTFPLYFDDTNRWASMYGFKGSFKITSQAWHGAHLVTVCEKSTND
jgi:SAM-dependent methyltransferase